MFLTGHWLAILQSLGKACWLIYPGLVSICPPRENEKAHGALWSHQSFANQIALGPRFLTELRWTSAKAKFSEMEVYIITECQNGRTCSARSLQPWGEYRKVAAGKLQQRSRFGWAVYGLLHARHTHTWNNRITYPQAVSMSWRSAWCSLCLKCPFIYLCDICLF